MACVWLLCIKSATKADLPTLLLLLFCPSPFSRCALATSPEPTTTQQGTMHSLSLLYAPLHRHQAQKPGHTQNPSHSAAVLRSRASAISWRQSSLPPSPSTTLHTDQTHPQNKTQGCSSATVPSLPSSSSWAWPPHITPPTSVSIPATRLLPPLPWTPSRPPCPTLSTRGRTRKPARFTHRTKCFSPTRTRLERCAMWNSPCLSTRWRRRKWKARMSQMSRPARAGWTEACLIMQKSKCTDERTTDARKRESLVLSVFVGDVNALLSSFSSHPFPASFTPSVFLYHKTGSCLTKASTSGTSSRDLRPAL